MGLYALI